MSAVEDHGAHSAAMPEERRVLSPGAREPELKNVLPLLRMKLEGGATWQDARRFLISSGLRPDSADALVDSMSERCRGRSRPKAFIELAAAAMLGVAAAWSGAIAGLGAAAIILGIAGLLVLAAGLVRLTNDGLSEVSASHNFWRLTPNEQSFLGHMLAPRHYGYHLWDPSNYFF